MISIDVYGESHIVEKIVSMTNSVILFKRVMSYTTMFKIKTDQKYIGVFLNKTSHPYSFILYGDYTNDTIRDLSKIMHKILSRDISIKTNGYRVERYYNDELYIRLYPTIQGQYLYLNSYHLALIENISKYLNYGLVSSNILSDISVNEIDIPGLKHMNDLYVYEKDVFNLLNIDEKRMMLDAVKSHNTTLRESGHTRMIGYNSIVAEELAKSFNMKILEFDVKGITIKSPHMIGCELQSWMNNSILRIKTNKIIIVNVYGNWQHKELSLENKFKILYMSHISYSKIDKIENYREEIKVLDDMSVNVPLFSHTEYIVFVNSMNNLYKNFDKITYDERSGLRSSIDLRKEIMSDNIYSLSLSLSLDGEYAVVTKNMNQYIDIIDDNYGFETLYRDEDIVVRYPDAHIKQTVNTIEAIVKGERFALYVLSNNSDVGIEVLDKIQNLWNEGYYMTVWGKFYFSAYEKISVYLTIDPIFVRGNQINDNFINIL